MAMTEANWLHSESMPFAMHRHVHRSASTRKLRLASAAGCRLALATVTDVTLSSAVEALERHADGLATEEEFVSKREPLLGVFVAIREAGGSYRPEYRKQIEAIASAMSSDTTHWLPSFRQAIEAANRRALQNHDGFCDLYPRNKASAPTRRAASDILREIFGNPFRPFLLLPSWQGGGFEQPDGVVVRPTSDVIGLAAAIHLTGDFSRLPILADALEEAGATDETLLRHCRGPGPHVRGCWAHDIARGVS
jgi:hypothetical protein